MLATSSPFVWPCGRRLALTPLAEISEELLKAGKAMTLASV
jgi:hypothetical protein